MGIQVQRPSGRPHQRIGILLDSRSGQTDTRCGVIGCQITQRQLVACLADNAASSLNISADISQPVILHVHCQSAELPIAGLLKVVNIGQIKTTSHLQIIEAQRSRRRRKTLDTAQPSIASDVQIDQITRIGGDVQALPVAANIAADSQIDIAAGQVLDFLPDATEAVVLDEQTAIVDLQADALAAQQVVNGQITVMHQIQTLRTCCQCAQRLEVQGLIRGANGSARIQQNVVAVDDQVVAIGAGNAAVSLQLNAIARNTVEVEVGGTAEEHVSVGLHADAATGGDIDVFTLNDPDDVRVVGIDDDVIRFSAGQRRTLFGGQPGKTGRQINYDVLCQGTANCIGIQDNVTGIDVEAFHLACTGTTLATQQTAGDGIQQLLSAPA